MTHELYKKYRPKSLSDVIGQNGALSSLSTLVASNKVPHTTLITGPSGCGKTTVARILALVLKCSPTDLVELNAADSRGIETVRDIQGRVGLSPLGGCRIWIIDECHRLTNDAQSALLKMLEDVPRHVYFMLATTDPTKLLPTIKTRCTEIRLNTLTPKDLRELLGKISGKEKFKLSEEVQDRIIEVAEGSARKALVLLDSILGLKSEEEQLDAVLSSDSKRKSIDLARALLNLKCQWTDLRVILKDVDEEPETLRRMVLGYMNNVLLGGGKQAHRAFEVIKIFEFDTFNSGKAGLTAMCYQAILRD